MDSRIPVRSAAENVANPNHVPAETARALKKAKKTKAKKKDVEKA